MVFTLCFTYCVVRLVCVIQDSTLCPLTQHPTTTLSISTVPVHHWWLSVLWKTQLTIARRERELTFLQVGISYHLTRSAPQLQDLWSFAFCPQLCQILSVCNIKWRISSFLWFNSQISHLEIPQTLPLPTYKKPDGNGCIILLFGCSE